MFVLDRTDSLCVIFRLFGFEALQRKQTSIGARRRPGHGSEAGSACLRNRVLSSPVSCQNRKGQGRKWRLCVLAAGPALPDSDPAGQEQQTLSGRNPRRGSWCYFYHFFFFFYKAQHGMLFPAVDTALGHFCLQNSAAQHRERLVPCLLQFYWPRAAHGCGLCLRREVLFDTELIMKARHSCSLDDPQTFLTILFPSG